MASKKRLTVSNPPLLDMPSSFKELARLALSAKKGRQMKMIARSFITTFVETIFNDLCELIGRPALLAILVGVGFGVITCEGLKALFALTLSSVAAQTFWRMGQDISVQQCWLSFRMDSARQLENVRSFLTQALNSIERHHLGVHSDLNRVREELASKDAKIRACIRKIDERLAAEPAAHEVLTQARCVLNRNHASILRAFTAVEDRRSEIDTLLKECKRIVIDPLEDFALLFEVMEVVDGCDDLVERTWNAIHASIPALNERLGALELQTQRVSEQIVDLIASSENGLVHPDCELIESVAIAASAYKPPSDPALS